MIHKGYNCPYGEVEGMSVLLGYKTASAGGCKVSMIVFKAEYILARGAVTASSNHTCNIITISRENGV